MNIAVGEKVIIVAGEHEGAVGQIEKKDLVLNTYYVKLDNDHKRSLVEIQDHRVRKFNDTEVLPTNRI